MSHPHLVMRKDLGGGLPAGAYCSLSLFHSRKCVKSHPRKMSNYFGSVGESFFAMVVCEVGRGEFQLGGIRRRSELEQAVATARWVD